MNMRKHKFPTRLEALKHIHEPIKDAPQDFSSLPMQVHKRIIFEEFFWLEELG